MPSALIAVVTFVVRPGDGTVELLDSALYLFGSLSVAHVLRDHRPARLPPGTPEAAVSWPVYVHEWTFWNHVRTARLRGDGPRPRTGPHLMHL